MSSARMRTYPCESMTSSLHIIPKTQTPLSLPYAPMQCNCVCALPHYQSFSQCLVVSTNVDTLSPEFCSCLLDLRHQLRMRLGYVVESKDSPAELKEEVCAERD